jgi:hypothetical protein
VRVMMTVHCCQSSAIFDPEIAFGRQVWKLFYHVSCTLDD